MSDGAELAVARLAPDAILPARAHPGDAGLDLCAAESAALAPGERVVIGTGVVVAVPDGHAGLVMPRSGLASRHGVTVVNAPGLIDSGYRGELRVALVNLDRRATFEIRPGDRIAQLVIVPVALAEPVESDIDELGDTARGSGGFGSTGVGRGA